MPRLRAQLFSLLAIVVLASPCSPADRRVPMGDYVQEVWESREGTLPHPGVTIIEQARDGYLLVGTYTGVVRFDGVKFERPSTAAVPALRDHVRCVLDTADGLWVGTRREGAMRIVGRNVVEVLNGKNGLDDDLRAIAQTPDGVVWFATSAGVFARDAAGGLRRFTTRDGLPSDGAWALWVDGDGTLWIGTGRMGLVRHAGGRLQRVPLPRAEAAVGAGDLDSPFRSRIISMARDASGVMWVGTPVGLSRLSPENLEEALEFPGVQVSKLVPGRNGLWVATSGSGLIHRRADRVERYGTQDGLLHDSLLYAFEDAEGSLWMGTRLGLARLRPRIVYTHTAADGLTNDAVFCVMQASNGDIWAGHRGGASRLRDGRWTTLGVRDGLPAAAVNGLAEGPDGTVWMGTLDGVVALAAGRMTVYRGAERPYTVRALGVDAQGRVWVGALRGVDVIENGAVRRVLARENAPCRAEWFSSILVAPDQALWIATGGGGIIRGGEDGWECLRDDRVLARNDVRGISEGAAGAMWVSSIGGLWRITSNGREYFSGSSGPFDTTIYGAVEDGRGALWCNTPKGIFQIILDEIGHYDDPRRAPFIYRALGTGEGMATTVGAGDGQPTAWRSRDGRLWFTTVAGLTVVDPSRLEASDVPPAVHVEALAADRQPVDLGGSRRLPAGTRDVELRFAAISFREPERVYCRYKLEGFDTDWIDSGARRAAYYTNLPPGRYRFHAVAASSTGVWNETGAALAFEILPRFWQTRWFLPLVLAVVVSAGTAAYRVRIARLRANELELQRRVEQATAQIKTLRGLLPICASCKKIRDDTGYWSQMETYISSHSAADFSHSICPECVVALYPEYAARANPPR